MWGNSGLPKSRLPFGSPYLLVLPQVAKKTHVCCRLKQVSITSQEQDVELSWLAEDLKFCVKDLTHEP